MSKMSRTWLYVGAALAVLLGATYFLSAERQPEDRRAEMPHQEESVDATDSGDRVGRDHPVRPDVREAVDARGSTASRLGLNPGALAAWSAPSGRLAFEEASALPQGDPDREHLLRWIASTCRPANLVPRSMDHTSSASSPSDRPTDSDRNLREEWDDARREWCRGLSQAEHAVLAGPARSEDWLPTPSQAAAKEVIDALTNLDPAAPEWNDQAVIDELWMIVDRSPSPYLMRSAAHLLANTRDGPMVLASAAAQINAWANGVDPESQARLIRITAAELFFCRATGLCGPGTAMGLLGDPWISEEHRWTGREAVLRDALPPRHWQAAEQIAMMMLHRRSQALADQRRKGG